MTSISITWAWKSSPQESSNGIRNCSKTLRSLRTTWSLISTEATVPAIRICESARTSRSRLRFSSMTLMPTTTSTPWLASKLRIRVRERVSRWRPMPAYKSIGPNKNLSECTSKTTMAIDWRCLVRPLTWLLKKNRKRQRRVRGSRWTLAIIRKSSTPPRASRLRLRAPNWTT